MGEEHSTLVNRLKEALALHPQNLSNFFAALTLEEQQEIRQMIILAEELTARGLAPAFKFNTHRLPDFTDPVDQLRAAFSDLMFRAETRLTTHGREQVFGKWMDILTQRLHSRKQTVMLRWFLMAPTMSKRKFCMMIANENEAFPPKEREGWTSTNHQDIKSLINRELRELRAQKEPPRLSVIEGGKGTKTPCFVPGTNQGSFVPGTKRRKFLSLYGELYADKWIARQHKTRQFHDAVLQGHSRKH